MTAKDSKSTPKKAEDATLLERLDTRIRELQEYRGIYTQAVQQTELVYQDQGLLEDQLDDQAREYIALLSEVRDEITAQAEALAMLQVMREGHERTIKRAQQRGETGDATVAAFYGNVVSTHEGFCAQLDLIAAALGAQS